MPIDNSTRFPKPLAADLRELSEGMAIVIDGDTAPKAIASGQYLFIKNHSTLATGGYHATAAIASGADITSSNVTPDADGIVNGAFSSLSEQIATKTYSPTFLNASASGTTGTTNVISRSGNVIHVFFDFTMTSNVNAWTTFITTNIPVSDASFEKNCGIGLATTETQSAIQITEYLRALVENGTLCFRSSVSLTSGKRYRTEVTLILP